MTAEPAPRAELVLIGPMGSGKTRLGKRVAKLIGVPFADTDKIVVAEHGPIAELFDTHGEPHFRALERDAVAGAIAAGGVVSLGGGAVLDEQTRALLETERVVLLWTTPEAVEARIANGKRPLVRGGVDDWIRIAESRRPIYEALARHRIDTSSRPIDHLAAELADWWRTETGAAQTGRTPS
ncbi:shikimate kinase [Schumannella luteola]|uniref:Shikimate kinase n=1 Tax=Schumannella luteola TaxID=472059 RepID=A0A852YLJ1_9MICO|nr:shikimate kinase [Schumannella luteola]NYH00069.1 shikimate kinase [Schumannella luteola]TPX06625.1 shikimate kinase [Schumannella luteola]